MFDKLLILLPYLLKEVFCWFMGFTWQSSVSFLYWLVLLHFCGCICLNY